jgi:hypothetical protein
MLDETRLFGFQTRPIPFSPDSFHQHARRFVIRVLGNELALEGTPVKLSVKAAKIPEKTHDFHRPELGRPTGPK